MTATAFGAPVTVLQGAVEIEVGALMKTQDRNVRRYWYNVLIGERLPGTKPWKLSPRQELLRRLFGYLLERRH